MGYGSSEGSSPSDPPFAQLRNFTQDSKTPWKDKLSVFAGGAFNSLAPDEMKSAVSGAGDQAAYLKRKRYGNILNKEALDKTGDDELIQRAGQAIRKHLGGR